MDLGLKGKKALVFGGSAGLGRGIAEALIAEGLARGHAVQDIALANGVSYHTARTQLKSLMRKTSTSRQGELIALLLKSLPV